MPSLLRVGIALFLVAAAFEGPLRYYASTLGLPLLSYVPKSIGGLCLLLFAMQALRDPRQMVGLMLVGCFVALGGATGVLYQPTLPQTLFGLGAVMAVFLGFFAHRELSHRLFEYRGFCLCLFFAVAVGVIGDRFLDYPWSGYSVQIGDTSIVASRNWTTFGVERAAGFSRSSIAAASILLTLGVYLVSAYCRRVVLALVWITAGVAIAVTTTKAIIGIYLILSAAYAIRFLLVRPFWVMLAYAATLTALLLPFVTVWVMPETRYDPAGDLIWLHSLFARMEGGWPAVIEVVRADGSEFLGRGFGGIGAAAAYFEGIVAPGDNLFVYVYGILGIPGVVLILVFALSAAHAIRPHRSAIERVYASWALVFLVYGITNNNLELTYVAFVFGHLGAHLLERSSAPSRVVLRRPASGPVRVRLPARASRVAS
jgi:hypothetical protein